MELFQSITLKLDNNQFRCDCDIIDFLKWFPSTNSKINKKINITCTYRGINTISNVLVDVSELEFQCTKFMRILYISLGSASAISLVGVLLGMTLFKYRWHIRWYWFRIKRRMLQSLSDDILLPSTEHNFACYVNYLGVTSAWVV